MRNTITEFKTCSEIAGELVAYLEKHPEGRPRMSGWADAFKKCFDFPHRGVSQVWQWRVKLHENSGWAVRSQLMNEQRAAKLYANFAQYEKHAGPFEVEE